MNYLSKFALYRLLPVPLKIKMAVHFNSWLLPVLLSVGCIFLAMNILNARKANKSLGDNIEKARADLMVAMDISQECSKQVDLKSVDTRAKDQQLVSLTADVKTLTEEKNQIQEQLNILQEQLNQTNTDKDAVEAEKNQLANELEAAIAANPAEVSQTESPKEEAPKEEALREEEPKEEVPKEEVPKEEAPKEEAPKEEVLNEEAPK